MHCLCWLNFGTKNIFLSYACHKSLAISDYLQENKIRRSKLIIDVLASISILLFIKRVVIFTLGFVCIATDFMLQPESNSITVFVLSYCSNSSVLFQKSVILLRFCFCFCFLIKSLCSL